jgi:hypothetical protein
MMMLCTCAYDGHERHLFAVRCVMLPSKITLSVFISSEFTVEERADIVAGINVWHAATSGMVTWSMSNHMYNTIDTYVVGRCDTFPVNVMPAESTSVRVTEYDKKYNSTPPPGKKKSELVGIIEPYFPPYSTPTNVWLVRERLHGAWHMSTTVAHEFGHVMGLKHNNATISIMNESAVHMSPSPSYDDIMALRAMYR